MDRMLRTFLFASACFLPAMASAQTIGGAVPPYEAPPPVAAPQRDSGAVAVPVAPVTRDMFAAQDQLVRDFSTAYQKAKRPRLAIFWNRELSDTLNEWYSDSRLVIGQSSQGSLSGNIDSKQLSGNLNLQQSGSSQTTLEAQRRVAEQSRRLRPSESWEWQFQDGFLAPLLKSGATVIDRSAIIRLTGVSEQAASAQVVETKALQSMADLLIEILVAPQGQSTTGYELRARVLEIKSGRILSFVNSRGLREWNQPKPAIATNRGFELPEDDDDDETFGPQASETRYKATPQGFVRNRKPPKLSAVSQNLAYNVMDSLVTQWR